MKTRLDFVTNSSSSSFLMKFDGFVTVDQTIEQIVDEFDYQAELTISEIKMMRQAAEVAAEESGNPDNKAKRALAKLLLDKDIDVSEHIGLMDKMIDVIRAFKRSPDAKFIITNEMNGLVSLGPDC